MASDLASVQAAANRLKDPLERSSTAAEKIASEIAKLNQQAGLDKARASSTAYVSAAKAAAAAQRELNKALKDGSSASDGAAKSTAGLGKGLAALAGATLAVNAIREVTSAARELAAVAAHGAAVKDLETSFRALGGTRAELAALRSAIDNTISDSALIKMRNMGVALGISKESIAGLAKVAKTAALATGQDITFMFDSIVTGTARRSVKILDNLGISATAITAELAKSSTTLNTASQQQFEAAVIAASASLESVGALKAQADAYGQISAGMANATDTLAKWADDVLRGSGALGTVTSAGKEFGRWVKENEVALKRMASGAVVELSEKLRTLFTIVQGLSTAYLAVDSALSSVGTSIGGVVKWFNPMTYLEVGWNNLTNSVVWGMEAIGLATEVVTQPMRDFLRWSGRMTAGLREQAAAERQAARDTHELRRAMQGASDATKKQKEIEAEKKASQDAQDAHKVWLRDMRDRDNATKRHKETVDQWTKAVKDLRWELQLLEVSGFNAYRQLQDVAAARVQAAGFAGSMATGASAWQGQFGSAQAIGGAQAQAAGSVFANAIPQAQAGAAAASMTTLSAGLQDGATEFESFASGIEDSTLRATTAFEAMAISLTGNLDMMITTLKAFEEGQASGTDAALAGAVTVTAASAAAASAFIKDKRTVAGFMVPFEIAQAAASYPDWVGMAKHGFAAVKYAVVAGSSAGASSGASAGSSSARSAGSTTGSSRTLASGGRVVGSGMQGFAAVEQHIHVHTLDGPSTVDRVYAVFNKGARQNNGNKLDPRVLGESRRGGF